jgi:hypothetical protein
MCQGNALNSAMQCVYRRLAAGLAAGSGAGGHEGGEDVVRVAVKVLAGSVVAHVVRGSAWRAAIWTSRRSTPASSMVVTKVWRSMCGCALPAWMPAVSASRRRRRVAACRSIRAPRLLSRIGPLARPAVARSMARPTAGGRASGTRTILVPLPHTRSTRWRVRRPGRRYRRRWLRRSAGPAARAWPPGRSRSRWPIRGRRSAAPRTAGGWTRGWAIRAGHSAGGRVRPGSVPARRR